MDLHERRQLDMVAQMAKVKARARPWRSIIALALACGGLAAAELGRHSDADYASALTYSGALAFFLFGTAAAFGLSGQARNLLQPVIGAAHAGVTRYALVLAGIFAALVIALKLADVPVGQLVLGGAVTGVLLGIAAQQSLANLFAGLVLLFARPFRVGDQVRFRAGALYGVLEGTVVDISITYVRLETAEGLVFVPNSQALAAAVGPLPAPGSGPPDPESSGSWQASPEPPSAQRYEPEPPSSQGYAPELPSPQAATPQPPAPQAPAPQAPSPHEPPRAPSPHEPSPQAPSAEQWPAGPP